MQPPSQQSGPNPMFSGAGSNPGPGQQQMFANMPQGKFKPYLSILLLDLFYTLSQNRSFTYVSLYFCHGQKFSFGDFIDHDIKNQFLDLIDHCLLNIPIQLHMLDILPSPIKTLGKKFKNLFFEKLKKVNYSIVVVGYALIQSHHR